MYEKHKARTGEIEKGEIIAPLHLYVDTRKALQLQRYKDTSTL